MEEKRKSCRWNLEEKNKAVVSYGGQEEQVTILDISAGGMKFSFSHPLDIGSILYGKFRLPSNMGPFFIKGKVDRVFQDQHNWEVAVAFEKVSAVPLEQS